MKTKNPKKKTAAKKPAKTAKPPVRVCDIGKNCPPMVEGAMRAVRGLFQDAVDATRPLRPVADAETVAADLPGTSPEEMTRAAQAAAVREAEWHKQNAERLESLAAVYNPGIQSDGATRRAMLVEAGLLAPDASAAAERGRLAAIQEAIQKDPRAWEAFAEESKKEEALRNAALARAEKAGDILRQLQTDKVNMEHAAAMREHAAALREAALPAPSSSKPDGAKGGKDVKDATRTPKPRVPKGVLDLVAEFMKKSRRQVQRYLDGTTPVPAEFRGFGYHVLLSKETFKEWVVSLHLGEGGKEFISRFADAVAGFVQQSSGRPVRPRRVTHDNMADLDAPNPAQEAARNMGDPDADEDDWA